MVTGTINAVAASILGDTGTEDVGTWVIQLVSSSFVGSVLVKARATKSGAAYATISYKNRADDSVAASAITGSLIIEVNAAGLDIELDCTAFTSGSLVYYAWPLTG